MVVPGAALGTALGPVGTVVGAGLGATFGAIVGGGVSEGIEPAGDEKWVRYFQKEEFARSESSVKNLAPAYHLGWLAHTDQYSFDQSLQFLELAWPQKKGESTLEWTEAIPAARAGWLAHEEAGA